METETCPKNAITPVCISVSGISEQHQILSEDTSATKAWKASGKPGHSFDAGKKPKTPHGSSCSKSQGFTVLGGSVGCWAAWFPEARVVCVTSASTDESALPAVSSVHLADGFCDSYWLVEGVKVIYLRLKQNRAVRHLHNRPQAPQRGYFHVFSIPKVMMSCIIGSWRLCLKSCWVSISPPLLLPSQDQIDAAKQHHNIL